jgi:hypothetical protein
LPGQEYSVNDFIASGETPLISRAARCGELREELVHKHRNVFSTITQRRNDYVNDVEAIEQILAERPLLDHFSQVTVGRSDHTHVDDAATAVGANFLQLACLEESEQEALHAQRHLPDFVEEDGAHVGGFEFAGFCHDTRP